MIHVNFSISSGTTLLPRYFGVPDQQLFGVYHPPLVDAVRPMGVVLCYPGPQEYRFVHWAFRKLAVLLSRAGLHVLRFDYRGTGDSAGDLLDIRLADWSADIATAVAELQEVAGVRRVSLVGMRLGAALAAAAISDGAVRVKDLVLWEPILSGSAYLAQLEAVERRTLAELHAPQDATVSAGELLGYPMSSQLRAEIAAMDLMSADLGATERLLVVGSDPACSLVHGRALEAGMQAMLQRVDDPMLHGGSDEPTDTLLAHLAPAAIVGFLARKAS